MSPDDIERTRKTLRMTQQQFAEAIGLRSKSAVAHFEDGRRLPTGPVLLLLKNLQKKAQKRENRS